MLKLLIIANNCSKWKSWDAKIKQLKDWYAEAVDLNVTLQHMSLKDVPFEEYAEGKLGVKRDWYDQFITARAAGYDIVLFTVNLKQWKGKNTRGWRSGDSTTIQELQVGSDEHGTYSYNGIKHEGGRWFNVARHEIAHALYTIQKKADNTHKWFDLGKLENILIELKETNPTLILMRTNDDGKQTLGILSEGYPYGLKWNTLERPWLNNQKSISCISKGKYDVVWSFSTKFMKYTYEILKVPNRSGIRIHSGNFFFDIEGCILLGNGFKDINGDGKLDVVNSKVAIKQFEDFLQREPFTLIIQ